MDEDKKQRLLMAKRAVMMGRIVTYNDAPYIPIELTTRYQNGEWVYGVTLVDAGQPRSVVHAGMDKIDWGDGKNELKAP